MPASKLRIDTSEAASRKPLPDDTYECEILEIGEPQKGPKSTYVRVIFQVAEGEYENRKLYSNYMLDGAAAGMFVDLINKATGTDYDVDEIDDLEVDPADLIGARVGVVTKQEEYPEGSGEFRSQVARVLAL